MEVSDEQLFGIAKKINKEMAELPLHTHGALVQMITVSYQHRNLSGQLKQQAEQLQAQEAQLKQQAQRVELMQREQARRDATDLVGSPTELVRN